MKLWDIKNSKAFNVQKSIMKMIFVDNEPFLIVEDHGFLELLGELNSRYVIPNTKYFNKTMLQQDYDSLKL